MPVNREEHLKTCLQEYWINQKHFFLSYLDLAEMLDGVCNWYINNPSYSGRLCLKIATWFCKSDEKEWEKILIKHGVKSKNNSKDMSFYLNLIISDLQEVDPAKYTDPCMLDAIDMARDPQYAEKISLRKRRVSPIQSTRVLLRV